MPKYRLTLRLHVEQIDDQGRRFNEGLSVEDSLDLGQAGFMEIAGVLGRFHELAEVIKKERDL